MGTTKKTNNEDKVSLLQDLKFWIGILFLMLFTINVSFFMIYQQAHPDSSSSQQLWQYLESNISQSITASLIAPIIFFFLENRLQFLKSFRENQHKQKDLRIREQREKDTNFNNLLEKYLLFSNHIFISLGLQFTHV